MLTFNVENLINMEYFNYYNNPIFHKTSQFDKFYKMNGL
jgi:hypothetical protein